MASAHGFFVHAKTPLQVVGYKLSEENGRMLFLPKLGTSDRCAPPLRMMFRHRDLLHSIADSTTIFPIM